MHLDIQVLKISNLNQNNSKLRFMPLNWSEIKKL